MTTWKDIELHIEQNGTAARVPIREIARGDVIERRLITAMSPFERRTQDFIGVLPHATATVTLKPYDWAPLVGLLLEQELYDDCRHALAGDLYGWVPVRRGRCGADGAAP